MKIIQAKIHFKLNLFIYFVSNIIVYKQKYLGQILIKKIKMYLYFNTERVYINLSLLYMVWLVKLDVPK